MFDHVTLRVADPAESERFYTLVLGALGVPAPRRSGEYLQFGGFSVAGAKAGHPATKGLHLGFCAPDEPTIARFWQAGVDAGFTSDGAPGPRPVYGDDYRGAFLLDPDGNSVEAALHDGLRTDGLVDHLWIRVRDLGRSRALYDAVAPVAGFTRVAESPASVRYRTQAPGGGSVTLVEADLFTSPIHFALPAASSQAVDAFHAAALAAGATDDGAPGDRPQYDTGSGYYASLVRDADGHSLELVHRRGA